MKILDMPRVAGKTSYLVSRATEDTPIIVACATCKGYITELAKEMGKNVVCFTASEYAASEELNGKYKSVLVDNVDAVLNVLLDTKVEIATITGEEWED